MTGAPVSICSPAAGADGASSTSRLRMRLSGMRRSPRSFWKRKKRNSELAKLARRTKVPRPWKRSSSPSATSTSIALRTVPTATL